MVIKLTALNGKAILFNTDYIESVEDNDGRSIVKTKCLYHYVKESVDEIYSQLKEFPRVVAVPYEFKELKERKNGKRKTKTSD